MTHTINEYNKLKFSGKLRTLEIRHAYYNFSDFLFKTPIQHFGHNSYRYLKYDSEELFKNDDKFELKLDSTDHKIIVNCINDKEFTELFILQFLELVNKIGWLITDVEVTLKDKPSINFVFKEYDGFDYITNRLMKSNDLLSIKINLESKFDEKTISNLDYVYHCSNNQKIKDIIRDGISLGNTMHGDRTYFLIDDTKINNNIKEITSINFKKEKYFLLKVTTKNLTLYEDENYNNMCYCRSHVNFEDIVEIYEIDTFQCSDFLEKIQNQLNEFKTIYG